MYSIPDCIADRLKICWMLKKTPPSEYSIALLEGSLAPVLTLMTGTRDATDCNVIYRTVCEARTVHTCAYTLPYSQLTDTPEDGTTLPSASTASRQLNMPSRAHDALQKGIPR